MKSTMRIILSLVLLVSFLLPAMQTDAAGKFKDVSSNHWALKEIEFLSNKGVINGFNDGTFKPESVVTRGQAAIMLVRALGLSLSNRPNPGFKDVSTKHSAYKYIAAIVDEGIYPRQNNYEPDKVLTREEMAVLLVNSHSFKGQKNVTFSDVPKSYWIQSYVSLLVENGIAAGYSDGTFNPKGSVTRAQFSVFLSRCLDDRFKVEAPAPAPPAKKTPVLMEDITLGMTYQQVKSNETHPLIVDLYAPEISNVAKLSYEVEKYGVDTHLVYLFENNKLVYINYDFLKEEKRYHTRSQLASLHAQIQDGAIKEFGDNFYYYDKRSPSNKFVSSWFKVGYGVSIFVNDDQLYTQATLTYHQPIFVAASSDAVTNADYIENKINKLESELEKLN